MITQSKCLITIAGALSILAGGGAPAAAKDVTVVAKATPREDLSQIVLHEDLNLALAADVKRLNFRVRGAIRQVCAPLDDPLSFDDHLACTAFARAGAKPQMERAIARAAQLASLGTASIVPVAIVVAAPR